MRRRASALMLALLIGLANVPVFAAPTASGTAGATATTQAASTPVAAYQTAAGNQPLNGIGRGDSFDSFYTVNGDTITYSDDFEKVWAEFEKEVTALRDMLKSFNASNSSGKDNLGVAHILRNSLTRGEIMSTEDVPETQKYRDILDLESKVKGWANGSGSTPVFGENDNKTINYDQLKIKALEIEFQSLKVQTLGGIVFSYELLALDNGLGVGKSQTKELALELIAKLNETSRQDGVTASSIEGAISSSTVLQGDIDTLSKFQDVTNIPLATDSVYIKEYLLGGSSNHKLQVITQAFDLIDLWSQNPWADKNQQITSLFGTNPDDGRYNMGMGDLYSYLFNEYKLGVANNNPNTIGKALGLVNTDDTGAIKSRTDVPEISTSYSQFMFAQPNGRALSHENVFQDIFNQSILDKSLYYDTAQLGSYPYRARNRFFITGLNSQTDGIDILDTYYKTLLSIMDFGTYKSVMKDRYSFEVPDTAESSNSDYKSAIGKWHANEAPLYVYATKKLPEVLAFYAKFGVDGKHTSAIEDALKKSVERINNDLKTFGLPPITAESSVEGTQNINEELEEYILSYNLLKELITKEGDAYKLNQVYMELFAWTACFTPFQTNLYSEGENTRFLSPAAKAVYSKYAKYRQPISINVRDNGVYTNLIKNGSERLGYCTLEDFVKSVEVGDVFLFANAVSQKDIEKGVIYTETTSVNVNINNNGAQSSTTQDNSAQNSTTQGSNSQSSQTVTKSNEVVDVRQDFTSELSSSARYFGPVYASSNYANYNLNYQPLSSENASHTLISIGQAMENPELAGLIITSAVRSKATGQGGSSKANNNSSINEVMDAVRTGASGSQDSSNNQTTDNAGAAAAAANVQMPEITEYSMSTLMSLQLTPNQLYLNYFAMHNVLQNEDYLQSGLKEDMNNLLYIDFLGNIVTESGYVVVPAAANATRYLEAGLYPMFNAMVLNAYPDVKISNRKSVKLLDSEKDKLVFYVDIKTLEDNAIDYKVGNMDNNGASFNNILGLSTAPRFTSWLDAPVDEYGENLSTIDIPNQEATDVSASPNTTTTPSPSPTPSPTTTPGAGTDEEDGEDEPTTETLMDDVLEKLKVYPNSVSRGSDGRLHISFFTGQNAFYDDNQYVKESGLSKYFVWAPKFAYPTVHLTVDKITDKAMLNYVESDGYSYAWKAILDLNKNYYQLVKEKKFKLGELELDNPLNLNSAVGIMASLYSGSQDTKIFDFEALTAEEKAKADPLLYTFGSFFEVIYNPFVGSVKQNELVYVPTIEKLGNVLPGLALWIIPIILAFVMLLCVYIIYCLATFSLNQRNTTILELFMTFIVTVFIGIFLLRGFSPTVELLFSRVPTMLLQDELLLQTLYEVESRGVKRDNTFFSGDGAVFSSNTQLMMDRATDAEAIEYREGSERKELGYKFYMPQFDSERQDIVAGIFLQNKDVKIDTLTLLNTNSVHMYRVEGNSIELVHNPGDNSLALGYYTPYFHITESLVHSINSFNRHTTNNYKLLNYNGQTKTTGRAHQYFSSIFFVAGEKVIPYIQEMQKHFALGDITLNMLMTDQSGRTINEMLDSDATAKTEDAPGQGQEQVPSGTDEGSLEDGERFVYGDSTTQVAMPDGTMLALDAEMAKAYINMYADFGGDFEDWLGIKRVLCLTKYTGPFNSEYEIGTRNTFWYPKHIENMEDGEITAKVQQINDNTRAFVLRNIGSLTNITSDQTLIKVISLKATMEFNKAFSKDIFAGKKYPREISGDVANNDFLTKLRYMPTSDVFKSNGDSIGYYLSMKAGILGTLCAAIEVAIYLTRTIIYEGAAIVAMVSALLVFITYILRKKVANKMLIRIFLYSATLTSVFRVVEVLIYKLEVLYSNHLAAPFVVILNLVLGILLLIPLSMMLKNIRDSFHALISYGVTGTVPVEVMGGALAGAGVAGGMGAGNQSEGHLFTGYGEHYMPSPVTEAAAEYNAFDDEEVYRHMSGSGSGGSSVKTDEGGGLLPKSSAHVNEQPDLWEQEAVEKPSESNKAPKDEEDAIISKPLEL